VLPETMTDGAAGDSHTSNSNRGAVHKSRGAFVVALAIKYYCTGQYLGDYFFSIFFFHLLAEQQFFIQ